MTRHFQRGNLTTEIASAHERITQLSSKLEMANNTICEYEQKAQWLESLENQLASMQSLATVGTEEHKTAQAALAVRLEAQVFQRQLEIDAKGLELGFLHRISTNARQDLLHDGERLRNFKAKWRRLILVRHKAVPDPTAKQAVPSMQNLSSSEL